MALLDLPLELLQQIIREVANFEQRKKFEALKALRLTCKSFYETEELLKHLFESFRLVATPYALHNLDTSDRLERLSPFVEHVAFRPYCSVSNVNSGSEVDVSRYEIDDDEDDDEDDKAEDDAETESETARDVVKAAQRRPAPYSTTAVWTKVLQKFQKRHVFTITTCTCLQDDQRARGHSFTYHGPCGNSIFEAAVRSIYLSQTIVKHLRITFQAVGMLNWQQVAAWKAIDFSQLKRFVLLPRFEVVSTSMAELPNVITATLERFQNNLQQLAIVPQRGMEIPGDKKITLPMLNTLILGPLNLTAAGTQSLKHLISHAPKLSDLEIRATPIRPNNNWHDIFRVIREHPSRMKVYLGHIYGSDGKHVAYGYHTYTGTKTELAEQHTDDFQRSLSDYLSGVIEWNDTLENWWPASRWNTDLI